MLPGKMSVMGEEERQGTGRRREGMPEPICEKDEEGEPASLS